MISQNMRFAKRTWGISTKEIMDMDLRIFMKEVHDEMTEFIYKNRDPEKPDYDPYNDEPLENQDGYSYTPNSAMQTLESESFRKNQEKLR